VLSTDGHTAPCEKVFFTPDGTRVITVSLDKTVRFWDAVTGEALRVLRLPLGPGRAGVLYAAALSPDGQTLAVGGFWAERGPNPIFLISVADGQIVGTLREHAGAVLALTFSPDGKRLASAGGDTHVLVWDWRKGERLQRLEGHTGMVLGLAFAPGGGRLASASHDATARVWSLADGKELAVLRGHDQYKLACVAWSPDGQRLVTGGEERQLHVWKPDGRFEHNVPDVVPPGRAWIFDLQFPKGRSDEILATWQIDTDLRHDLARRGSSLIDLQTGRKRPEFTETNYRNDRLGSALAPDGSLAATSGGTDHEICLWRTADGKVVRRLRGKGQTPLRVGWGDDGRPVVAWGNVNTTWGIVREDRALQRAFDLTRLRFVGFKEFLPDKYASAVHKFGDVSLDYVADDPKERVAVRRGNQRPVPLDVDYPRAFTLLGPDRSAVGGGLVLRLIDTRSGERLHDCRGVNGRVRALAASPDGRYLLAACGDQVLRIWDTRPLAAVKAGAPLWPLLYLFIARGDWIAWTEEGYYAASPGGERLMGWAVDNGPSALPTFYRAGQFQNSLYRPDVLALLFKEGTVQRALEAANAARGSKANTVADVADVRPPQVSLTVPADRKPTQKEVKVTASAQGSGAEMRSLQLLLDERPYQGQRGMVTKLQPGKAGAVTASWDVELPPGTHTLRVLAQSAVSSATSAAVEVTYEPPAPPPGPTLYVLSIGIDKYPKGLELDAAVKDATALVETLTAKGTPQPYGKVQTALLTDRKATRKGILDGLGWLKKNMTEDDTAVIFYAGHGYRDRAAGQFYLVAQDANVKNIPGTAVSGTEVREILIDVPGKILVLLDACHSGAIGADKIADRPDDLRRQLSAEDCGVVTMCAAMGSEEAGERGEHGYFTQALLDGLQGKAHKNRLGFVHLTALHFYVEERVSELSKDEQHVVIDRPTGIYTFPLTRP
jgi:WD40 repeat protein